MNQELDAMLNLTMSDKSGLFESAAYKVGIPMMDCSVSRTKSLQNKLCQYHRVENRRAKPS
jgi:hypothetical protein